MRWLLVLSLVACSHRDHRDQRDPGDPRDPAVTPDTDRIAAWRDDLRALATELPAHHANAFFHLPEATWRRDVAELDRQLPRLDDAHILAGLARLVAAIGDAHTGIGVFGQSGVYPLAIVWFDDGIFVVGADDPSVIGRKIVGIGTHSIDDVIATLTPLIPHDNIAGVHAELPGLLLDRALLVGTDLVASDHATFQLAAADGSIRAFDVHPGNHGAPVAPPRVLPLHLQGPDYHYWNKYVADQHLLYFAYNACTEDDRAGPFARLVDGTLAFADQHPVDRFVIDLRRNEGGNSQLIDPLIAGIAARPALAGHVFAIIGMHTFSSAMIDAMELKRKLHATLVGGETSSKPSGYGEVKTFTLPHSKLLVQYSTKLFANPDFPGDAVEPDVPIKVTGDDWFSGRDPALDAIVSRTDR